MPSHLFCGLEACHRPAELFIHITEALLLRWQCATPKDGLEVHPLALDLIEEGKSLL